MKTDTVLELLEWCDKPNTVSVTLEEAETFWEALNKQRKRTAAV